MDKRFWLHPLKKKKSDHIITKYQSVNPNTKDS